MACACGSASQWTAQRPNGTSESYRTFAEANADVARNGGQVVKTR